MGLVTCLSFYKCLNVDIILNKNNKCNNFNDFTELQFIWGNQLIEINDLTPNLWISHDSAGVQPGVGLGGIIPSTWELGQPIQMSFSPHMPHPITDRKTPQFHQLSGWLVSDDPAGERPHSFIYQSLTNTLELPIEIKKQAYFESIL